MTKSEGLCHEPTDTTYQDASGTSPTGIITRNSSLNSKRIGNDGDTGSLGKKTFRPECAELQHNLKPCTPSSC